MDSGSRFIDVLKVKQGQPNTFLTGCFELKHLRLVAAALLIAALWLGTEVSVSGYRLGVSLVGAVAALLCFLRSRRYETHVRWGWILLGGGLCWYSLWPDGATLRSLKASSPVLAFTAGLVDELTLNSLTIGFYLAGLLWLEHDRCRQINARFVLDLALALLSLLAIFWLVLPRFQGGPGASPESRWLSPLAAFAVTGGAVVVLFHSGKQAPNLEQGGARKWLLSAAAANVVRHVLIADWSEVSQSEQPFGLPFLIAASALAPMVAVGFAAASPVSAARLREPPHRNGEKTGNSAVPLIASFSMAGGLVLGLFPSTSAGFGTGGLASSGILLDLILLLYVSLMLARLKVEESESRRNDASARQQGEFLRVLLDNINDAVVTEDLGGRIQFANRAFYRLFGLSPEKREGLQVERLIHPEDQRKSSQRSRIIASGRGKRFHCRGLRDDGVTLDLEISQAPLASGGIAMGIQSVIRDISRLRLIERSQRAMAQRLEFFVSDMPLGCVIWDAEFAVQEWNQSAERIFGWTHSEVLNRRYADFLAPREDQEAMERLWRTLSHGNVVRNRQCENLTKRRGRIECEWFHTSLPDDSGQVAAVASMVRDITEVKNLERQLLQSQKMEAVGTLAGGIAHDFNNLLTAILGRLTLAQMKLGPGHEATAGLRDAERAAEKAADLVQQLLRFGRRSHAELTTVGLNGCIEEVARLFHYSLDSRIEMDLSLAPDLWPVKGDRGQIEQVLMNLLVNARDAVSGPGRIRIESANRTRESGSLAAGASFRTVDLVELTISDTGHGMDRATQSRIFEPFFTTKEVGKGTGLGLAMVYAIVKAHGGWVEVFSSPGEGSTFRIYLPRTYRPVNVEVPVEDPTLRPGVETVLLADDEDLVRDVGRQILEGHGYRVMEARDGLEAVEIFRRHQEQIGLVILDLTMPRKSGWDAFDEIHQLNPGTPVVIASGYSFEGRPESERGVRAFLPTPFKASELLSVVQDVLDCKQVV